MSRPRPLCAAAPIVAPTLTLIGDDFLVVRGPDTVTTIPAALACAAPELLATVELLLQFAAPEQVKQDARDTIAKAKGEQV